MIGVSKLSEALKNDLGHQKQNNSKLEEMQQCINQIYAELNKQEQKLNEKQKETNHNNIDALKDKLEELQEKNKQVATLKDLNDLVADIHESFMIFLNNTPRSDVTELRDEIKLLKSELAGLKKDAENRQPQIINLDRSMEITSGPQARSLQSRIEEPEPQRIPKLNISKSKPK